MKEDDKAPRINVQLTREQKQAIRDATVGKEDGPTISRFIREAIDEKLGRDKPDAEDELLLERFHRLNGDGKAWLLQAAKIAAASDEARQITPRPRKKKTE